MHRGTHPSIPARNRLPTLPSRSCKVRSQNGALKLRILLDKNSIEAVSYTHLVDGRPKTDSQTLLYSIDALHTAINRGCLVQFRYKGSSAVRTVRCV